MEKNIGSCYVLVVWGLGFRGYYPKMENQIDKNKSNQCKVGLCMCFVGIITDTVVLGSLLLMA